MNAVPHHKPLTAFSAHIQYTHIYILSLFYGNDRIIMINNPYTRMENGVDDN